MQDADAAAAVRLSRADPIEQRRDIRRHHHLRIGERVHQEHFIASRERHTEVEHRGLHQILRKKRRIVLRWACDGTASC